MIKEEFYGTYINVGSIIFTTGIPLLIEAIDKLKELREEE